MHPGEEDPLTSVAQWFAERGFGLSFTADEDEAGERFYWADLTRPADRVVAPKYGRGDTELAAAVSAMERFEVEQ